MGNSNSAESESATPPKFEKKRSRILSVDPRSPTAEISRTPIVVTKTPEGGLHDPLDPRSPTVGIDRTPLNTVPVQKNMIATESAYTPETEASLDSEATAMLPVCDFDMSTEGGTDTFDGLGVTGIEDMSLDDFPNSESTRLMVDEKLMMDISEKVRQKKKKSRNPQPKELFPLKKSASMKESTRSPLATRTVDMNSPAQIVQRRQIKDVDMKMTCTQENSLSRFIVREKENM